VTWTPLSRSKGQRLRSPGRFTHRGLNTRGRCSGDHENVLGVGSYCYVASGAGAPTGRRGAGHIVSPCAQLVLRYVTLCYELSHKVAVDLLAASASQAFVERLFSVSGMLSHGKRNRMEKSLEMRVMFCMRVNNARQH